MAAEQYLFPPYWFSFFSSSTFIIKLLKCLSIFKIQRKNEGKISNSTDYLKCTNAAHLMQCGCSRLGGAVTAEQVIEINTNVFVENKEIFLFLAEILSLLLKLPSFYLFITNSNQNKIIFCLFVCVVMFIPTLYKSFSFITPLLHSVFIWAPPYRLQICSSTSLLCINHSA